LRWGCLVCGLWLWPILRNEIKLALQRAAELEHRSIANMVEVLIREHCRVKGIATGDTSNNKRAAKGATS